MSTIWRDTGLDDKEAVGLVCALYLWRSHSLERVVHLCILPTCGVVINKAALEPLQWLIMTTWGCCWVLQCRPYVCLSVGVPPCSAVWTGRLSVCRGATLLCCVDRPSVCLYVCRGVDRFMCTASESENNFTAVLVNPVRSSVRLSSRLWNHWRTGLYARHWIIPNYILYNCR